jgi:hypothetical protein
LNATKELITALVAGGMDAADAAGLVARAGVEMTGALTKNMSTGLSGRNPVESPEYRALEKRRAWDRDRKRRERDGKRASAISTGLPPDSTGLSGGNADVCPDEEEKNRSLQGKQKKENKKGSRLLSGARISDEQRSAAVECGCPPDRVDAVWTEFVGYWSDIPGQKGCKLTWNGTWRNWVNRIFGKANNGHAVSNNRADTASGRATAREMHAVTTVADAALQRLRESKSAGSIGQPSGSPGSAEVFDFGGRSKNAG